MSYQSSWFLIPQHPNYKSESILACAFCLLVSHVLYNYVVLSVVPEDGEAGGRLERIMLLDAKAELVLQVGAKRHAQQESSSRQQKFKHEKEHNQAEILVNISNSVTIWLKCGSLHVFHSVSLCLNFSMNIYKCWLN